MFKIKIKKLPTKFVWWNRHLEINSNYSSFYLFYFTIFQQSFEVLDLDSQIKLFIEFVNLKPPIKFRVELARGFFEVKIEVIGYLPLLPHQILKMSQRRRSQLLDILIVSDEIKYI